jgi:ubiquinone/menaquinone biosynthesis C-methylase UbiE
MKDFWENMSLEYGIKYFKELDKDSSSHVPLMGNGKTALDFGCGAGRNIKNILKNFENVVAYDLPNILKISEKFNYDFEKNKCKFTSKWEDVSNQKFDCILADSSFNHVEKKELIAYLKDMQKMTDKIIVHGRRIMDDGGSDILPILNKHFNVEVLQSFGSGNNEDTIIAVLKN